MKKILILLLAVTSLSVKAQWDDHNPTDKYIEKLKNSTLIVILNEGEESLKNAVEQTWTFSKYKFVTEAEVYETYEKSENDFYLGYFEGKFVNNDYIMHNVPFIGITNKIRKKYEYEHDTDFKVYFPFSMETYGDKYNNAYVFFNVFFLNNYLVSCAENSTPENNTAWKQKKMLICKDDLFINETLITSTYKFDYELVSRERIAEAILQKEDVVIYYINPVNIYSYHMFISPQNGTICYKTFGGSTTAQYTKSQPKLFKLLGKL